MDSCSQQENPAPDVEEENLRSTTEDHSNAEKAGTCAESPPSTTRTSKVKTPRPAGSARKRTGNMTAVESSINKLQKISELCKEDDDEFDYFGKSIAVQLRKMPLARALVCQQKLQAVLTEERLFQLTSHLSSHNPSQRSSVDSLTMAASPSYSSEVSYSPNENTPDLDIGHKTSQNSFSHQAQQDNINDEFPNFHSTGDILSAALAAAEWRQ